MNASFIYFIMFILTCLLIEFQVFSFFFFRISTLWSLSSPWPLHWTEHPIPTFVALPVAIINVLFYILSLPKIPTSGFYWSHPWMSGSSLGGYLLFSSPCNWLSQCQQISIWSDSIRPDWRLKTTTKQVLHQLLWPKKHHWVHVSVFHIITFLSEVVLAQIFFILISYFLLMSSVLNSTS